MTSEPTQELGDPKLTGLTEGSELRARSALDRVGEVRGVTDETPAGHVPCEGKDKARRPPLDTRVPDCSPELSSPAAHAPCREPLSPGTLSATGVETDVHAAAVRAAPAGGAGGGKLQMKPQHAAPQAFVLWGDGQTTPPPAVEQDVESDTGSLGPTIPVPAKNIEPLLLHQVLPLCEADTIAVPRASLSM